MGLTSSANRDFTTGLGCYDEVSLYADLDQLDAKVPSVYIDFAGDAGLRRQVHERCGDSLKYSSSIGGTHWEALGSGTGLPGAAPDALLRSGPDRKAQRGAAARLGAAPSLRSASPPPGAPSWRVWSAADDAWLTIVDGSGAEATETAYRALLDGRADPREGLMLSLSS